MAHCYVQILKPQQSVPLPIRSVQINDSPNETNHRDVIHDLSRSKPKKLVFAGIITRPYVPKRALENLPCAGPVSVDFDTGPVDFDFLHWPLTKSQNFRQDLSCSVFRVDSNFGLRFSIWNSKLVNWHILHCGFFKGIFKESSHAYLTSSFHRASALSLREGVRDIF